MPPGPPIASIGRLIGFNPRIVVPGHGPISVEPLADLQLTRDDLVQGKLPGRSEAANTAGRRRG